MKKSILIFLILFSSTYGFSQFNSEFDYFTFKAGAIHTVFTPQPDTLPNKMVLAPNGIDHLQAFPDSGFHMNYSPGYYAGLYFNHDLQNDNLGISVGVEYKMYGITSHFYTIPDHTLKEVNRVSSVSVPVYIKFGQKFYEPQKYIYAGASISYNLFATKTEKVSYIEDARTTKIDNTHIRKTNVAAILGFNYMFFNVEANYVFGNFLSSDYTIGLGNYDVQPYAVQPKGVFYIKTGLAIPINSWTSRKWYAIEQWVRRLLR